VDCHGESRLEAKWKNWVTESERAVVTGAA
jgi:hypothetical protein